MDRMDLLELMLKIIVLVYLNDEQKYENIANFAPVES